MEQEQELLRTLAPVVELHKVLAPLLGQPRQMGLKLGRSQQLLGQLARQLARQLELAHLQEFHKEQVQALELQLGR